MEQNQQASIFGGPKEWVALMQHMSEASQTIQGNAPLRDMKIAQLAFIFQCEVEMFEFYKLVEYGKLKIGHGLHICYRNKELCPHKNHLHHFPRLWLCDTFLEFATGYMNFPTADLTTAELAEKGNLVALKPLLGNLLSTKQESEIKSPIPFQCSERHKLWRMPGGQVVERGKPSIVDKTIDYAVDVIGMPNSLRWRGEGGWRRG